MEDIAFFSSSERIPLFYFPAYNIMPFKPLAYHNETVSERIRILYHLCAGDHAPIVVITVEALLQQLIPKDELTAYAELLMTGEELDLDTLVAKLISGGYERSVLVEEPGDFSLRGGILDVFSPMYTQPLRIEMFGDTVESLRFFSSLNQRKTGEVSEAVILPARETILRKESLGSLIARIRQQAAAIGVDLKEVRKIVERIKSGGLFPGIESLLPLFYEHLDGFLDYLPSSGSVREPLFILNEPAALGKKADEITQLTVKNYITARDDGRLCLDPPSMYREWSDIEAELRRRKQLSFRLLDTNPDISDDGRPSVDKYEVQVENNAAVTFEMKNVHEKDHLLLPLVNWIHTHADKGLVPLMVCSTTSQIERVQSLLKHYGIAPHMIEGFPLSSAALTDASPPVHVCLGHLSSGFVWPEQRLAIITEDEIFGLKHHRRKAKKTGIHSELLPLEALQKGDFVVHMDHGIGRYDGLEKIRLNGVTSDFLLIAYRDEDRLYLPVDRMNMIQKYLGLEGYTPVLDKMGGKSWQKVKSKARRAVEKIAGGLLKLYAARKVHKGHAYSSTNGYYKDFEASFPYEETPDQLKAIHDVIADMEDETPMDRLICGDVGYGKTEVAMRAAFKAVSDGRQVAILVPTTVLAEQHRRTFAERFERYPVTIESLSRFRSPKEQRRIVQELVEGKIDIVIGTHRLLQKDIAFKALGLLVIDEEQRFGVKHKEKLKQLRASVDVLALTATPIPRTLHMSLMGIRDISVISTPPEQRQAVVSYVCEFEGELVAEAIRKELKREGQIFFVHNNINTIWKMAEQLQQRVPEVRLDVAHGRLTDSELEQVMFKFINREIDMLVCTTIIESGLDIPSANTMLIYRADRLGLAQIYQLRGRVGRGNEQAYAYLFIPRNAVLSKDAQKRLRVLMEHSDLGSGFQLAMSDLQIRGGGTTLGASQSGHIAAIGYDMFLKLMEQAVSELKGENVVEDLQPEININLSTHFPEDYIPVIDQRLSIYRRLARLTELSEIVEIKDELIDRYGPLPDDATNVLLKIMLKILSVKAGVKRLDLVKNNLTLFFSEAHQKHPFGLVELISRHQSKWTFTPDQVLKVHLTKADQQGYLVQTRNILKEIAQHVNG
jgi:transcription-repair coupling factor (superfamily II helicase)